MLRAQSDGPSITPPTPAPFGTAPSCGLRPLPPGCCRSCLTAPLFQHPPPSVLAGPGSAQHAHTPATATLQRLVVTSWCRPTPEQRWHRVPHDAAPGCLFSPASRPPPLDLQVTTLQLHNFSFLANMSVGSRCSLGGEFPSSFPQVDTCRRERTCDSVPKCPGSTRPPPLSLRRVPLALPPCAPSHSFSRGVRPLFSHPEGTGHNRRSANAC